MLRGNQVFANSTQTLYIPTFTMPQQKRPTLVEKGRRVLETVLSRRKRLRMNVHSHSTTQDIEDDRPMLSRVADHIASDCVAEGGTLMKRHGDGIVHAERNHTQSVVTMCPTATETTSESHHFVGQPQTDVPQRLGRFTFARSSPTFAHLNTTANLPTDDTNPEIQQKENLLHVASQEERYRAHQSKCERNSAPNDGQVEDTVLNARKETDGPKFFAARTISAQTLRQEEPVLPAPYTNISNLPLHATTRPKGKLWIDDLAASFSSQSSSCPDHLHKSPTYVAQAYFYAHSQGVKRKRGAYITCPSPPAYTFRQAPYTDSDFDIFRDGFLHYPELILHFASHLPARTLIALYSISRDFHVIVNQRFTTVILNQVTRKAPGASTIWPWRSYARLCQSDPACTRDGVCMKPSITLQNHRIHQHAGSLQLATTINNCLSSSSRDQRTVGRVDSHPQIAVEHSPKPAPDARSSMKIVPSFKWLHMALHRTKTLTMLFDHFARKGVPLPLSCYKTMQKIWFMFDIPDTPRRIGYVHSKSLFKDADLCLAMTFIVRLDMLLNDPVAGEKRDNVRKLLLSSCDGFDMMLRVLRGEEWRDNTSALRTWVRYGLQPALMVPFSTFHPGTVPARLDAVPFNLTQEQLDQVYKSGVFGVPFEEVGRSKLEFWGQKQTAAKTGKEIKHVRFLMRIDQLVMREAIRRGLKMRGHFYKSLLWGYVDPISLREAETKTLDDIQAGLAEEWEVDDAVQGLSALNVKDGGGDLLDLGATESEDERSSRRVKKRTQTKAEFDQRKKEKEFTNELYRAWEEDSKAESEREIQQWRTKIRTPS